MITYNDLYEALRKERYSEQLQSLSKDFVKLVAVYLKEKEEIAKKDDDLFSENVKRTKRQLEEAASIFNELMRIRKKKLLDLAFVSSETGISKRDYENMLSSEKDTFERIMKAIEDSKKDVEKKLSGKDDDSVEEKHKLVVFKQDTEEFLDLEGNKLGPFKEGDIVNLPQEIANILLVDNKVDSAEEE